MVHFRFILKSPEIDEKKALSQMFSTQVAMNVKAQVTKILKHKLGPILKKDFLGSITVLVATLIIQGCATPTPPTTLVAVRTIEVERIPVFDHVLLLPVTGNTDEEGKISNQIQNEALKVLGKGVGTADELRKIFAATGSPQLLPLAIQPQLLWFENLLKNNEPTSLVQSGIERFPGLEFSYGLMKDPMPTLRSLALKSRQLENLSDLVQKNDKKTTGEILASQQEMHAELIKLFYWSEVQYKPNYLLNFYFEGDKENWEKGAPIKLKTVAINFDTGGIRFACSIIQEKKIDGVNFEDHLSMLTNHVLQKCMRESQR